MKSFVLNILLWAALLAACLNSRMAFGIEEMIEISRLDLRQINPESINQKRDPELAALAWKLVKELNDPSFIVRDFARLNLLKLGRASIEPLEYAAQSEDSETRLAAVGILIALRGRGFLGVGMIQTPAHFDGELNGEVFPPNQVNLNFNLVPQGLPAQTAGIASGDIVMELNGQPVRDINDLQREVIVAGPARTLAVVVLRGDELLRFNVVLTLNMSPLNQTFTGIYVPPRPPLDLESELSPGEKMVSADANLNALQFMNQPVRIINNGVVVINGQVFTANTQQPAAPKSPSTGINLNRDFVMACENQLQQLKRAEMASSNSDGKEEAK